MSLYALFSPCKAHKNLVLQIISRYKPIISCLLYILQGISLSKQKVVMKKTWFMVFFHQKTPQKQAVILLFQTEKWREKERRIEREITIYYHKKNTKDSIPYDEKTGIVFVYTVWISPMMHSVVTRSVQYVLQRTQRFYILKKKERRQCSIMEDN